MDDEQDEVEECGNRILLWAVGIRRRHDMNRSLVGMSSSSLVEFGRKVPAAVGWRGDEDGGMGRDDERLWNREAMGFL